jgi:DNA-binding response OmpR family regulator
MTSPRSLLLAVADEAVRAALADEIARAGWRAAAAARAAEVRAQASLHDLLLLDLDLPDEDGLALCRALRTEGLAIAIVLMAAGERAADAARAALEAGADDCLARPFRAGHLVARLDAAWRQRGGARDADVALGDWTFRAGAKQLVDASGRTVRLTEKETAILEALRRAYPAAVPRETLLAEVWGYGEGIDTHTLQTHVYRLRRKIEPEGQGRLVLSDEGGYRLGLDPG